MKTMTSPISHQKIIHYYEDAGPDYFAWSKAFNMHFGYFRWGMNPFDLEAMLNQMNQEVMDRLLLDQFDCPMVLDLGCGLGTTARYISHRRPDARLYGITITPWQVEQGKGITKAEGLADQVFMIRSDYTDMPFMSNCVDAAYALESACYAKGKDKKDFIDELHRVLKPGGRFVITDGFMKGHEKMPGWYRKIYQKTMDCWALEDFADIDLFVAQLKRAGFTNIKIEDASWRVAPSVLHIPKTVLSFLMRRWKIGEKGALSRARRNNVLGPVMGMLLGMNRKYFSYYIITGEKKSE